MLEKHKRLIFKISNSYCKSNEDRKDLTQEITFQLWKAFPDYNDEYAFSTWIYRISLNVAISFYRKEKTKKKALETYKEVIVFDEVDDDEGKNEQTRMLYTFIEELNPLDKAIIILHLEAKKNKEIATIMGISATNVSTKINRIKNKLRLHFKSI